jgi:hypothetical protein
MNEDRMDFGLPSGMEIWNAGQTLASVPDQEDKLFSQLDYISNLLADAGTLPNQPILVWRENSSLVRHAEIGHELIVGREAGNEGVELGEDKSLSARHFTITVSGGEFLVTDLGSRNGTRVNDSENLIQSAPLRDGDLILAGKHIFAFLNSLRDP